jgi:hypothetical protein
MLFVSVKVFPKHVQVKLFVAQSGEIGGEGGGM